MRYAIGRAQGMPDTVTQTYATCIQEWKQRGVTGQEKSLASIHIVGVFV